MTYNALDNITAAEKLQEQLILEILDIQATLDYNRATDRTHNEFDELEVERQKRIIYDVQKALREYIGLHRGD